MGTRASLDSDTWDEQRWVDILDRMEYRQPGVGLRFWGPPLWLEVTMEGPDSDAWSVAGSGELPDEPWDWQSVAPCDEVMELAAAGADDDDLLEVAARYTVENLVLNSAHEIGEWLRFDARRLFSAHPGATTLEGDDGQGNGAVTVGVGFHPFPEGPSADERSADERPVTDLAAVTDRAQRLAAPWRFTYLPGVSVAYDPQGPGVADRPDSGVPWSAGTAGLLDAPEDAFVSAVQRDVHRMLLAAEAQRVCAGFYVDGLRRWDRVALRVSYHPATG